jgi:hypothetical protein
MMETPCQWIALCFVQYLSHISLSSWIHRWNKTRGDLKQYWKVLSNALNDTKLLWLNILINSAECGTSHNESTLQHVIYHQLLS